jgi:hypothetical protein
MPEQQSITGEQLEQALQTIATAVKWSEPPRSDTVAPGDRHAMNAQAMQVVIICARQAMKNAQEAQEAQQNAAPAMAVAPELVDVNANGTSEPDTTE